VREDGALSFPLAVAALLVAALAAAAVLLVGFAAGGHGRAQTAADAAALAAVGASPLAGGDGRSCAAAARVAVANGAELIACDGPDEGWSLEVTVTVRVAPPGPLGALLPPSRAMAAARLRPASTR
jgi:secretion/DNA translocation related TadE-like protein